MFLGLPAFLHSHTSPDLLEHPYPLSTKPLLPNCMNRRPGGCLAVFYQMHVHSSDDSAASFLQCHSEPVIFTPVVFGPVGTVHCLVVTNPYIHFFGALPGI